MPQARPNIIVVTADQQRTDSLGCYGSSFVRTPNIDRLAKPGVRDVAIVECVDDPRCLRLKTAITATRKLTWYAGQTYGELYDLEKDPREKINHWNDPQYAGDRAALVGLLLANQESLENRSPRHCYA